MAAPPHRRVLGRPPRTPAIVPVLPTRWPAPTPDRGVPTMARPTVGAPRMYDRVRRSPNSQFPNGMYRFVAAELGRQHESTMRAVRPPEVRIDGFELAQRFVRISRMRWVSRRDLASSLTIQHRASTGTATAAATTIRPYHPTTVTAPAVVPPSQDSHLRMDAHRRVGTLSVESTSRSAHPSRPAHAACRRWTASDFHGLHRDGAILAGQSAENLDGRWEKSEPWRIETSSSR